MVKFLILLFDKFIANNYTFYQKKYSFGKMRQHIKHSSRKNVKMQLFLKRQIFIYEIMVFERKINELSEVFGLINIKVEKVYFKDAVNEVVNFLR